MRRADFVETVPEEVVIEAQQKLRALLAYKLVEALLLAEQAALGFDQAMG